MRILWREVGVLTAKCHPRVQRTLSLLDDGLDRHQLRLLPTAMAMTARSSSLNYQVCARLTGLLRESPESIIGHAAQVLLYSKYERWFVKNSVERCREDSNVGLG